MKDHHSPNMTQSIEGENEAQTFGQIPDRRKSYYAERLLSQAIADPSVNALDKDAVRTYIEQEAAALCLDPDTISDKAMTGYETLTTGNFKAGTHYRRRQLQSPAGSDSRPTPSGE